MGSLKKRVLKNGQPFDPAVHDPKKEFPHAWAARRRRCIARLQEVREWPRPAAARWAAAEALLKLIDDDDVTAAFDGIKLPEV